MRLIDAEHIERRLQGDIDYLIESGLPKTAQAYSDILYKIKMEKTIEMKKETESNSVNHPAHYNSGKIETIDYIESLGYGYGFCIGNAVKYLSRAEHKGTQTEDLKKAIWYTQRAVEQLERSKS